MHKHFRVVAISEHLRNHGFDPDVLPHTRIPGIWAKLRTLYNLDAIDEMENTIDYNGDGNFDRRYLDFDLPWRDYGDKILDRARATDSDAPTSPAQWNSDEESMDLGRNKEEDEDEETGSRSRGRGRDTTITPAATKKRRRVEAAAGLKVRGSTVDDTEGDTPGPPSKSARSARSAKRAASKARKAKEESTEAETGAEEEEEEEADEDEGSGDEEEEEEQADTPATKSVRGGGRGRGRGRGAAARGKGRAKGRNG